VIRGTVPPATTGMSFLGRPIADTAFVGNPNGQTDHVRSLRCVDDHDGPVVQGPRSGQSRLHDIRHFVATAMIAQGLNVRQWPTRWGTPPSITLDVYSHEFASDLTETSAGRRRRWSHWWLPMPLSLP